MAESTWTTGVVKASDGYALGYRLYLSPNPKGPVVGCVHGIQSHSDWYDRSCRFLADAGFTTYFFDRRGSGINTVDHGHAKGFRILLDDFRRCLLMMHEAHPASPVIVQAISWGGKVAAATLADHSALADGLILVAPGFMPKVRPPFIDQLCIAFSTFLNPRRMLPVPLSNPSLFTENPEWMRFIEEDSVAVKQATARLLFSSRMLDFRLRRKAKNLQQPTLLVLASRDRIIDNAKTREFVKRFSTKDLEIIEFKAAHTLEFEPEPTEFFETLRRWIEKRFLRGGG